MRCVCKRLFYKPSYGLRTGRKIRFRPPPVINCREEVGWHAYLYPLGFVGHYVRTVLYESSGDSYHTYSINPMGPYPAAPSAPINLGDPFDSRKSYTAFPGTG